MTALRRVVVVGSSGSGKTTMASKISKALGAPLLEMDAVMHADGWNSASDEAFRRTLGEFATGDSWVIDGNYTGHGVAEAVWPRADTFVWLDPPKGVVMGRVIRRTLRRMVTREKLWNGLTEPLSNLYKRDPYENIIVWTWTRFEGTRETFARASGDGSWAHAAVYRLRSKGDVARFLDSLTLSQN
jgi:adenylate kinase family enzyme